QGGPGLLLRRRQRRTAQARVLGIHRHLAELRQLALPQVQCPHLGTGVAGAPALDEMDRDFRRGGALRARRGNEVQQAGHGGSFENMTPWIAAHLGSESKSIICSLFILTRYRCWIPSCCAVLSPSSTRAGSARPRPACT